MVIFSRNYLVIGCVTSEQAGGSVPLLDISLMTDEEWHRRTEQNAVANYVKAFGRQPDSAAAAVEWQTQRVLEAVR